MSCTVEITESALADMDAVYRYIRNVLQAPSAAAATYDRIADAILSLEDMPLRYGIPQFAPCISLKLHRMLVGNYSVFYQVRGDTVIVTDVLYSASDLKERLGDRYEE